MYDDDYDEDDPPTNTVASSSEDDDDNEDNRDGEEIKEAREGNDDDIFKFAEDFEGIQVSTNPSVNINFSFSSLPL